MQEVVGLLDEFRSTLHIPASVQTGGATWESQVGAARGAGGATGDLHLLQELWDRLRTQVEEWRRGGGGELGPEVADHPTLEVALEASRAAAQAAAKGGGRGAEVGGGGAPGSV